MPRRTLLIMRHADAEPSRPGVPDHDRALTATGCARAVAQASVVGAAAPDLVLCSSAVRARQTLAQLEGEGALAYADVRVVDELYGAGAGEVVDLLGGVDAGTSVVLLVGHMPTVAELHAGLAAGRPGAVAFTPGAISALEVPDPWEDLSPGTAVVRRAPA